ncbi:MAG: alpha-glucan family phosphorylase [Chromatiales bacterium]|jgi:starch phosphorylase
MKRAHFTPFLSRRSIAYFSMEIGLHSDIPTYSGGLGVLAGDTLRSAADLELPLVGVTLVSRKGYFRQQIDAAGWQQEAPDPWEPQRWCPPLRARICVPMEGHDVWVQAWLYTIEGGTGYQVPVLLLDTDLEENSVEDRRITDNLYGGDEALRLQQEIVLGIGGVRMLRALGFEIGTYHMNEGHSALLSLELLWQSARQPGGRPASDITYDIARVRDRCLFTTHTPVKAGHDKFPYDLVERLLRNYIDLTVVRPLAGEEHLNMTQLALSLSGYVNGVTKSHAETSKQMFPGYRVHAITNGIHPTTWAAPSFQQLYDQHLPIWRHEPEILVRADQLPDEAIWQAHQAAKQALIEHIRQVTGKTFDPELPIIGFARRITAYKRPNLLFQSPERLLRIAREHPFQLVMAGKAHPKDAPAKTMLQQIQALCNSAHDHCGWAFLPDYDMSLALLLVSGADFWLNTPKRPMEASGTSGMKAALNGVPNLSILDGWWVEGCIEGITGWAIGTPLAPDLDQEDAESLYHKLGDVVLPLYRNDRQGWIRIMKGAISKNAYYFNSLRMMRRYASEAYIR